MYYTNTSGISDEHLMICFIKILYQQLWVLFGLSV
ncbi:MAG: hypothetical protein ACI9YE_002268, partial [Psychroserpens sp.]